jgi:hypothetical protein
MSVLVLNEAFYRKLNTVLLSADGRDKFYRIIQYAARFLAFQLNKIPKGDALGFLVPYGDAFQSLSTAMAETRRVLRILRFLSDIFKFKDAKIKHDFAVLSSVWNGLYMFFENLLFLDKCKLIKIDNVFWNKVGNLFWLLSVVTGLVGEAAKLYKGTPVSNRTCLKLLCDAPIALNLTRPVGLTNGHTGALGTVSSWIMFTDIWNATK